MRHVLSDRPLRVLLVGLALSVGSVVAGCGKSDPTMEKIDASNLRTLAGVYPQFVGRHSGKGPANEQEFKAFLKQARADITDVDKLFVSERDGKPYVILYGQQAPAGSGERVMGYEQEGKDGKRLVGLTYGQVREVDEAAFQKLVPPAKKP